MIISEYRSAASLAEKRDLGARRAAGQGEAQWPSSGINVLIEWGPKTGRRPRASRRLRSKR